eukprot:gnl/MRDRNA2_/MRDRNA2_94821_c0_seq1.p1 gnl/MRDRNA2_/MRDRNA2_94821_c0~~gnl/MRDRNA2_/MRDRNA2_94821_c0_seq1.p1  ORF type:complete len:144 (-),score=19.47 gnl/MRDRNA2_/MRDRNA2_94821_c0_seq1:63-455(-)
MTAVFRRITPKTRVGTGVITMMMSIQTKVTSQVRVGTRVITMMRSIQVKVTSKVRVRTGVTTMMRSIQAKVKARAKEGRAKAGMVGRVHQDIKVPKVGITGRARQAGSASITVTGKPLKMIHEILTSRCF